MENDFSKFGCHEILRGKKNIKESSEENNEVFSLVF